MDVCTSPVQRACIRLVDGAIFHTFYHRRGSGGYISRLDVRERGV